MGVFGTKPAPAMYPGDTEVLSNAALGSATLTQSVAPCCTMAGAPANLTVVNKSAANLTIKVAPTNVAAQFEALTGATCAANSSLSFSTTAPFVAVLPDADPGTGVITICR